VSARARQFHQLADALSEQVQRRARAAAPGRGPAVQADDPVFGEQCARGWEHAPRWLDGIAALAEGDTGGNVVDLRTPVTRSRRQNQQ
jgi:hypothetical protein